MSYVEEVKVDPVQVIIGNKGTVLRGIALVASIAAMVLPTVSTSAMGLTQSVGAIHIAAWSLLAPLAIGVALAVPALAPRFNRLADIVAATVAFTVAAYIGYVFIEAVSQVSQATNMISGFGGNSAYAQSYTQSLSVSVSPSVGFFALIGAALLMILQAVLARK